MIDEKKYKENADYVESAIINGKLGIPFSDSLVSFIVQILFQDVCVFYR